VNHPPTADLLASLIELSIDAVVLVDAGGVIRWANPATSSVLGYGIGDVTGLRTRDLVEPADREA
jgi:PAS domain S-box-containing protein